MQRFNRSAAPGGAAFFLFLSLAIVPFSLRAVGFQVSLNPSFSAAADALKQIADVFGSGYQPARAFDSPPTDQGQQPLKVLDSSACPREFACTGEINEPPAIAECVSEVRVPKVAAAMRHVCPRSAYRACAAQAAVEQITSALAKATLANTGNLQTQVRALRTLSAMKFEAVTHVELLRNDALLKDMERQIVDRGMAIPQNLRMLVRVKFPAIPAATRAAQCKVRAALDSTRKIERERAMLTNMSAAEPDNCEL